MFRSVLVCLSAFVLFGLSLSVGCGEGGNAVIDQSESKMTEEFKAEEAAVGDGRPVET